MRLSFLLLLLLVISANLVSGHRENSYYLFGSFGDLKVGVAIDEFGEVCMARYFTLNDRYDHIMEGVISKDNWFEFYSYSWDQNKKERVKEDRLMVNEVEKNIWEGIWQSKNGMVQKVNLKRIVPDSLHHPYADIIKRYGITPYSAYRTLHIKFEKVKKEKINKGAVISHVIDPESGIEWFRVLPNKKTLPQVDSINNRLIADHLTAINAKYGCVYLGSKGDYQLSYKVHFLNKYLLSYTVTSHSACYGGPGDNIVDYHTLSIQSTLELKLEDLFWLGGKPQPQLSEGEYKWTQYRYKLFAPKIINIMRSLYPELFLAEKEDNCSYNNLKIWYFPKWYLTKKGLFLLSTSPLSSSQCKPVPQLLIPYANLTKYVANDFELGK